MHCRRRHFLTFPGLRFLIKHIKYAFKVCTLQIKTFIKGSISYIQLYSVLGWILTLEGRRTGVRHHIKVCLVQLSSRSIHTGIKWKRYLDYLMMTFLTSALVLSQRLWRRSLATSWFRCHVALPTYSLWPMKEKYLPGEEVTTVHYSFVFWTHPDYLISPCGVSAHGITIGCLSFCSEGRLGLGTQDTHNSPQQVCLPVEFEAQRVVCGVDCSMIISTQNTTVACGSNR